MAESTKKATVKRVFGSLINNATAIDGAKFSPWWIGLIMFLLGLLLPVLPLFVKSATTDGTSFLSSTEYGLGMDKTFGATINSLDGALTFNNADKTISYTPNSVFNSDDETMIGAYVSTAGTCKDQYELRVYFLNSEVNDETINTFVKSKQGISYKKGTTTVASIADEAGTTYIPSSVYFFKNTFYVDVYASNSTEIKAGMSFLADLKHFDYEGNNLKTYFCGDSFDINNKDNRINSFNKLKDLINVTYKTAKDKSMWLGSLIYIGIYAAMNLFMMLMIFLMSRGKNNPNNYLTFWACIKIDWWACFCPGLLGMILGFIFPSNALMIYVMLIAMRIMWLTMRELRPQYQ